MSYNYKQQSYSRLEQTIKSIHTYLSENKNLKIYDIGGYGDLSSLIEKKYNNHKVIDFNIDDLNTQKLNIENNSVDLILMCEVIEHLYNPDLVLEECYRILKKNGKLIITTPNLTSWFNRILFLFGYFPLNLDISCALRNSGRKDIFSKKPFIGTKFNPLYDVHIRLYTIKTLTILLDFWNLKVLKFTSYTINDSAHHKTGFIINVINRLFSISPHLGHGIILESVKK